MAAGLAPPALPATFTISASDPALVPSPFATEGPSLHTFPTLASDFYLGAGTLMHFIQTLDGALAIQRPYSRLISFCCRFLRLFCGLERCVFLKFDENMVGIAERTDVDPDAAHLFRKADKGQPVDISPEDWRRTMTAQCCTKTWLDVAAEPCPLIGSPDLADLDVGRALMSLPSTRSHAEYLLRMNVKSTMIFNIVASADLLGIFALHGLRPTSQPFRSRQVLRIITQLLSSHIEIADLHRRMGNHMLGLPCMLRVQSSLNNIECFQRADTSLVRINRAPSHVWYGRGDSTSMCSCTASPSRPQEPLISDNFNIAFIACLLCDMLNAFEADAGLISLGSESRILVNDATSGRPGQGTDTTASGEPRTAAHADRVHLARIQTQLEAVVAFLRKARFTTLFHTHRANVDLRSERIRRVLPEHSMCQGVQDLLRACFDAFEAYPGMMLVPLSSDGSSFLVFLRARKPMGIRLISTSPKDITSMCSEWADYEQSLARMVQLTASRLADERLRSPLPEESWRQTINHHLLTPLHAIINMAECALDEVMRRSTTTDVLGRLQGVRDGSKSLVPLMHDLLHFLQSKPGELAFRQEPYHLGEAVKNAAKTLVASICGTFGLDLDLALDDSLSDVIVVGDISKLRQIIWNQCSVVVVNTDKASRLRLMVSQEQKSCESISVLISAGCPGSDWLPRPAGERRKSQCPFGECSEYALLEELVKFRKGIMSYDAPSRSLLVRLELPLEAQRKVGPLPPPTPQPPLSRPTTPLPAPAKATGRAKPREADDGTKPPLHIIVAEDNEINRRILCKRLGSHTVAMACDGSACVQIFDQMLLGQQPQDSSGDRRTAAQPSYESTPPCDLVLMDIQMPVCDGIRATEQIRALEARHGLVRTPIIGVSASVSLNDWQRCREAGMDGFVPKPTDFKIVSAMIEDVRSGFVRLAAPTRHLSATHTQAGWFGRGVPMVS